jgi:nucleoid DNA-binding protein
MKKVLLTVTSGVLIGLVSFNAIAMDRAQLDYHVAHNADIGVTYAHDALSAFERKIKTEMAAGNRVSLTGFGTYKPEHCETVNGKEKCKLIKGGKTINKTNMVNAMAVGGEDGAMSKAGAARALESYMGAVRSTLKRGGEVDDGEETYGTKVRAVKTKILANGETKIIPRKVSVVHHEDPTDVRYRFVAQKGLRNALNNR